MKNTFLVFFVSLFLCITGTSTTGIAKRNKITTHQAKALTLAALTPEQSRLPGVEALSGKDFWLIWMKTPAIRGSLLLP
ncbi:MAG: hypothetical protein LBQ20_02605 [Rhodanobacter sp.]|jgi:hypothetical protein|nr:hypothetical protein [Rhodanobacter sp.]